MSHPHGCVSWNTKNDHLYARGIRSHPHGCVSWNLQRRARRSPSPVTPSRVCELKFIVGHDSSSFLIVTPSRVCELKLLYHRKISRSDTRHTLTGVWVEIHAHVWKQPATGRHTLTGVWVEIKRVHLRRYLIWVTPSRVCELKYQFWLCEICRLWVTPSRVCELKFLWYLQNKHCHRSHPHGCVSWN